MPERQDLKTTILGGLKVLGVVTATIVGLCILLVAGLLIWIEMSGGFHLSFG